MLNYQNFPMRNYLKVQLGIFRKEQKIFAKINFINIWSDSILTNISIIVKRFKNCKSNGETEEVYSKDLIVTNQFTINLFIKIPIFDGKKLILMENGLRTVS